MDTSLLSSSDSLPTLEYKKAPRRWLVIFAFAISNALNAYLWISFAPISNIAASRFNVSVNSINWLSLSYMLLYAPGAVLSIFITERFGMKILLLTAASANCLAAIIRWLGVYGGSSGFFIIMLGQCLAALAQPAYINAPARLSGDWFSQGEQATATVVASMSNVIGNALGSSLPSAFVSTPSDIDNTLLGVAAISIVCLILTFYLIREDAPLEPVSGAAAKRQLARKALLDTSTNDINNNSTIQSPVQEAFRIVKADFIALLTNRNFWPLLLGFGLGVAAFNAVLTLISQLLLPCGYGDDVAGYAGAAILGVGLVGAGISGVLLDMTQAFVPLLQAGIFFEFLAMIFLLSSFRTNAETILIIAFGISGFFLMPLLPLALENAAECTYPCAEDNSAALLLGIGNYLGVIAIFVLEALMLYPSVVSCSTVFTPSAGFLFALIAFSTILLALFRKDYRRKASSLQ
jgi:hypothetical protein